MTLPTDAGPCPICGHKMELKGATLAEMYVAHKCPESTLRAIDGAHKRDGTALTDPSNRSIRERMKDGSKGVDDADDSAGWRKR